MPNPVKYRCFRPPVRWAVLPFAGAIAALMILAPAGWAASTALKTATARKPAPTLVPPTAADATRYQTCLTTARIAPHDAFEKAKQWESEGGGVPARHCAAVALVALNQYGEAAMRLQALAHEPASGPAAMRAELLDQAGNAWILENQLDNAYAAFDAAVKLAPESPELFVDRARVRGMKSEWSQAVADLSVALSLDPQRQEAYVFRASAYRRWGNPKRALEDIQTALALDEKDPDALLESGAIHIALGDQAAARKDWLRAAEYGPTTPAGQAAQHNLQALAESEQGGGSADANSAGAKPAGTNSGGANPAGAGPAGPPAR